MITDDPTMRPDDSPEAEAQRVPGQEPVWTYRGYRLRASDFTTSMVHLFRAEVSRANAWRSRLDATTNWSVLTTGAAVSFAFTNQLEHHSVILLNALLVMLFMYIEARRYRYYELWSFRVRLLETDFFAAMIVPPFKPAADWAESMADTLLHPRFPISLWEALGRRLRRNYIWIYLIIGSAWILRLSLYPIGAASLGEFVARARIGAVPGWMVLLVMLLFTVALMALAYLTRDLHQATGEVLPRFGSLSKEADGVVAPPVEEDGFHRQAWFRTSHKRQQLLVFVITDQGQAVADRIMSEMQRGVTAFAGTGMYTGQPHAILMCALTVSEIPQLKALVNNVDPTSMVIVTPAQDVLGQGFSPLR
ncbi:MAG: DUF2270 domain-containing protein [Chloroflexi bacterium]|nr:DUF2270 domain-containing protein [Chloroflexota bacterium]